MKNLCVLMFVLSFGCSHKVVPVVDYWGGNYKSLTGYGKFKERGFQDSIKFQVETFRLGGKDTLYRKVVIDSSWIEK